MTKRKQIHAADLFCGAGGTSEGLLMAANEMDADLTLVAVNHWQVAIDTHSLNHPYAQHLCTGLDSITDPRKLFPKGRLNVLCASPECTHHSVARGGKPMSDQSRSSAWHILRFAEAVYIENIVIENVPEFVSWGPLGANGRPLKSRRGELFQQLIASLRALGYRNVEWKELVCADYGDPTTRKRLFVIARRNKAIRWPAPTHVPASQVSGLFAEARKPWRTAREIIDWTIPSKSIFERKRPLADKTLLRIQAGLKKFCGLDVDLKRCFAEDLRPFLVVFRNNQDAQSIDEPVPTLTTMGANVALVQPYVAAMRQGSDCRVKSVDEPLGTVTAGGKIHAIIEPFLAQWDQQGGAGGQRSIDAPVPTVVTKANTGVVEPFLVQAGGPEGKGRNPLGMGEPMATVVGENHTALVQPFLCPHPRENDGPRSIDRPVQTVTARSCDLSLAEPFLVPHFGERAGQTPRTHSVDTPAPTVTSSVPLLIEPFVLGQQSGASPRSVTEPTPTIATDGAVSLTEPYLVTVNHGEGDTTRRVQSLADPFPTVDGSMGKALCQPFLVAYYGTQNMSEVGEPLPTVVTKERFGLVEADVNHYRLDIRFRMLQPRELARAQGFPDSYKFTGNREAVVKQIGNAVPPNTAKALIMEVLQ